MKVGVYVDAFNLYYGGIAQFGKARGWKWLDIRALANRCAAAPWPGASVTRVVYCTARVNDPANPGQAERQQFYLRALQETGSVDLIEEGFFSSWVKEATLTSSLEGCRTPVALHDPQSTLQWSPGLPVTRTASGFLTARIRKREEKGSDVNVATHLLVDALRGAVDAAIVISNDSDLALPIRVARDHVPVGLLNPSTNQLAGALRGEPTDGVGDHWWRRLGQSDWRKCQLPATVNSVMGDTICRPASW